MTYFIPMLFSFMFCKEDFNVQLPQILEMMKKQAEHQDNTAELKEAFKIFDRDGNGYIDAEELKKVS
jgi:Ca2+-binding EF-hand superfamily protein